MVTLPDLYHIDPLIAFPIPHVQLGALLAWLSGLALQSRRRTSPSTCSEQTTRWWSAAPLQSEPPPAAPTMSPSTANSPRTLPHDWVIVPPNSPHSLSILVLS